MNSTLKYYVYGILAAAAVMAAGYFAAMPRTPSQEKGEAAAGAASTPAQALAGPDSLDKARAMFQAGDYRSAVKICDSLMKDGKGGDGALILQAEAYAQLEEYRKARANCDKVLKNSPSHPWALRTTAEILRKQKKYRDAGEYYRKAIAADASPGKADAACSWFGLGLIAAEQGDTKLARSSMETAVKLMPENDYFSQQLAQLK